MHTGFPCVSVTCAKVTNLRTPAYERGSIGSWADLASLQLPTVKQLYGKRPRHRLRTSIFLAAVKNNVMSYDPNLDALGYYRPKSIFANGFEELKQPEPYNLAIGPQEIVRLVED